MSSRALLSKRDGNEGALNIDCLPLPKDGGGVGCGAMAHFCELNSEISLETTNSYIKECTSYEPTM